VRGRIRARLDTITHEVICTIEAWVPGADVDDSGAGPVVGAGQ
jgi:hypothetical protein